MAAPITTTANLSRAAQARVMAYRIGSREIAPLIKQVLDLEARVAALEANTKKLPHLQQVEVR
jgi:hypothetical protein